MATPTKNAVPTTAFIPLLLTADLNSMLFGTKWGGGVGHGVTLTYSFPAASAAWLSPYSSQNEPAGLRALDAAQKEAARSALATWASVANVKFAEVADNGGTVGEIRFAFTTKLPGGTMGWAYMPADAANAGDIWFNAKDMVESGEPGSYFYLTMIHEVGHALGLNHSFALPSEQDNFFFSVMSYTASPWSADRDNYASFYPTTPMYDDILAIQAIYGASGLTSNAGDTTYTYAKGRYFETIFDTGGKDTIVYDGTDRCEIVLQPGAFNMLSDPIKFTGTSSRSTVAIGPNTIIENATGNAGNDRLEGNASRNMLQGRSGSDTLIGAAGGDSLKGGKGSDSLVGGSGRDTFDFNKVSEVGLRNHDIIADFKPGRDRIDLSDIDANLIAYGNDAFALIAEPGRVLSGNAGELRWYERRGATFVIGDRDGDTHADFKLELTGSKALTPDDFIL